MPPNSPVFTAKQWRETAEEARTIAEHIKDDDTRHMMLGVAENCDNLAERAEAREAGGSNPKGTT